MVNAQLLPVVGWLRREPNFHNADWSPKHPPEYFNTKENTMNLEPYSEMLRAKDKTI